MSGIAVLTVGVWVKVDKDVVNMQHLVEFDSNDKALTTASTVLVIFGPTQYVPNSCCVLSNHDAENPKPKDYPKCQEDAHKVQTNTTTTKDSKYLQTKLLGIVLAVYVCRRKEDDDDDY
ncbi:hypothetical protein MAR_007682 [Mya arenaria]|uniref:Uncharacterized protein n=1 Tax=Mya arenaria TaxID=6604 RepID=A0ABY7DW45_MYAAR|nr:hypothetical protein MAR_007682 [Mya arenaria]